MRTGTGLAAIGIVALVAALGTTGAAQADRGSGGSGSDRTIRMQDDCDVETFNAAVGQEVCFVDGDTEFDEFIEELIEEGEADDWRNNPDDTHVDKGERVHVTNEGGEVHTFTWVEKFGPGCVEELNVILGFGENATPAAPCGPAFAAGVPPGGSAAVAPSDLDEGHNHFQCMIHPWMQTTIEVRGDDD